MFNKKEKYATLTAIVTLAWPTIVEQIMQTAVQYIDTGMVASLGTRPPRLAPPVRSVGW